MPNYPIKYITDENGDKVLPKTHMKAVVDDNGRSLSQVRAPQYDPQNKRITFPATAAFQYDAQNKSIIISQ